MEATAHVVPLKGKAAKARWKKARKA